MAFLATAAYMFVPFIAAGILFAFITRKNWFPALARPVNARLFGKNKTWRGFVVTPVIAAACVWLWSSIDPFVTTDFLYSQNHPVLLAITGQLVFMLSELPNSYLKRRAGIAPGKRATKHAWVFVIGDLLDAAPGVVLIFWVWTDLSFSYLLALLGLGVGLKLCVNYVLYSVGVRKEPL